MNTNDTNRQKAHAMIDHIFKDLLPAQGMAERSEQIKLSHRMLDMLGHYSAGFTLNTYTHATVQMKQDAADTIGGVISQQMR